MPLLPSLIKKIDHFCKIAEYYSFMSVAADNDQTLLSELDTAAREVLNPDVSYTIGIFSDVYRKAVQIGGGFNTLYQMIQGILEDLDPEEDEQVEVENLLNRIRRSIELRAERPDSSAAVRELQQAASEAKRRLAEQAPDVPEDNEEDEMSPYEASVLGYSSAGTGDEEGQEIAKFDPSGGASIEAVGPKGRGWSVGKAHSYKDWAAIYAGEKAKYTKDMTGPDNMLSKAGATARKDSRVRVNLKELVDVLTKLEDLTNRYIVLDTKVLLESELPHVEEKREMEQIRTQLRALEPERVRLKKSLNTLYKQVELDNLRKAEALIDPSNTKGKLLLEQKIKLQELMLSDSRGKGKESKERRKLIDSMTADPNLSKEMIEKQLAVIQQAHDFTIKVTDQYRRLAVERAQTRGIKMPETLHTKKERVERSRDRGGVGTKRHEYDFAAMNLANYAQKITESLFAKRKTFKDAALRKLKAAGLEQLKPYIDDIATAANKGKNIGWATHQLSQQIRLKQQMEQVVPKDEVMNFLLSIRVSKLIYKFRDNLEQLNQWLGIDPKNKEVEPDFQNLDEIKLQAVRDIIAQGENLIARFKSYNPKIPFTPADPKAKTYSVPFGPGKAKGETVTDWIQKIVDYLKERVPDVQ